MMCMVCLCVCMVVIRGCRNFYVLYMLGSMMMFVVVFVEKVLGFVWLNMVCIC